MAKEESEVDFSFFDEEDFYQIQTILKDDILHHKLPQYISNMGDTTLEEIAAMSTSAYGHFVLLIPQQNENDDIQFNAYIGKDEKNGYFFGLSPWVPEKYDGTRNVGILLAEKYENALGLRFPLDTFLQTDYSDFENRMNLACSRFMDVLNRQYARAEGLTTIDDMDGLNPGYVIDTKENREICEKVLQYTSSRDDFGALAEYMESSFV